ncbi:MAG TPA: dipeptidase [Candidatus Acidoferrales bacterium]|nr:dipeptidase [Candidatus Acidoferrales bacterium]
MLDRALELARAGRAQAEADFVELLSIPSVSALSENRAECERAARWLLDRLTKMGLDADLVDSGPGGHPVVVGEWIGRPGAPTLTIYGHYDVQPPDPLEEWLSPPFEPTVRDGFIYARGASDNKGQHLCGLKAVEHWLGAGGPPLNLRFLIEGEEEVAGRGLPNLLHAHAEQLASDYVLIADGSFVAPGLPNLITGLRGLVYVEIEVSGAEVDLHSGIYGGVAPNPFNSLAHIIAGLKDRDGRIQIPGLYEAVLDPGPEEVASWAALPLDESETLRELGLADLPGEPGYSPLERRWSRPTLDVHGVMGGFVGEGSKTVIPARATAKVSLRLVPGQQPQVVFDQLTERVQVLATAGTRARVTLLNAASPVLVDTAHPGIAAASRAFASAFGTPSVLTREGGSIPVTNDFQETLHANLLVTGFGLPGDALHSPNERMNLDQFHRATEMVIHLIQELADV